MICNTAPSCTPPKADPAGASRGLLARKRARLSSCTDPKERRSSPEPIRDAAPGRPVFQKETVEPRGSLVDIEERGSLGAPLRRGAPRRAGKPIAGCSGRDRPAITDL